jgi:hypothetical protein
MENQLLLNSDDIKGIVNQRDWTEKMLEVFESIDNPSQKLKEKIEVLSMIVERLDSLVDDLCSVKEYYDMYNLIEAEE